MPPWGCPGGAGEEAGAPWMPGPSPCLPGLPWQAGAEGRASAISLNPGRPVRFWTQGPVGAPSPPLLGLSGPRFERIEGTEEGTG